ncbi:hypothetical protein Poli38472_011027 [Pythium oligandrum]|uniref:RRM domain-containing protein n=1 Tax=Pythium oligandrum TaxID=41045 RepID=A0A8K1CRJ8_PYTOL|nr:hypothetical protein Poli38472_011027 [Pythium oligandrum]|eukprot:TMW67407.1 hypothetical protein Poli38472_011027 [Pythium oligandrum]
MEHEAVYARILTRVERAELHETCQKVADQEAKLVLRRIRGAEGMLQNAVDVTAATKRVEVSQKRKLSTKNVRLLNEIAEIQRRVSKRVDLLLKNAGVCKVALIACESPQKRQADDDSTDALSSHTPCKMVSSNVSKAKLMDFNSDGCCVEGPTIVTTSSVVVDDLSPMELDVLDSDSDSSGPTCLQVARQLEKQSIHSQIMQLPALIRRFKREFSLSSVEDWIPVFASIVSMLTKLSISDGTRIQSSIDELEQVAVDISSFTGESSFAVFHSRLRSFSNSIEQARHRTTSLDSLWDCVTKLQAESSAAGDTRTLEATDEPFQILQELLQPHYWQWSESDSEKTRQSVQFLIDYIQGIPTHTNSTQARQKQLETWQKALETVCQSTIMSGFERILARVGGDALRDYCSSAIEDELNNLKTKMQSCLETVEKAIEVQDAIQKLNVPLSEDNVATFASIQKEYQQFSRDLLTFMDEQKKIPVETASTHKATRRMRTDSVASSVDTNLSALGESQRLAKLVSKIQHRLTKKHTNQTWILKNIRDMQIIASIVKTFEPEKPQRKEIVLALDHFISAVLIFPTTQTGDLAKLTVVLDELSLATQEIGDFAKSSRTFVISKLESSRQPSYSQDSNQHHQSVGADAIDSNATENASDESSEPSAKRQRIDDDNVTIKVERQQQDHASPMAALSSVHDVYVTELPWGTTQSNVESYFSVLGSIVSVRMPTMDDGNTVGVAMIRFATAEGMNAALRMDGYHFQGKPIRVALPKTN